MTCTDISGDVGKVDEDGDFWYLGREADMLEIIVKSGHGGNVSALALVINSFIAIKIIIIYIIAINIIILLLLLTNFNNFRKEY